MENGSRISPFEHPLAMGSFRTWLALLRDSGGIDREFLLRTAFVTATTLLTSPLRLYEQVRFGQAIEQAAVHSSPIFIIGHWRTGTTHLHNLLCRDCRLGHVSTFQAMAPGFFLSSERFLKPLVARIVGRRHPTRMIDNIPLSLDGPQEEEFALINASPHSCLHAFTFPRRASCLFERYALFEGLPDRALAAWAESYLMLLRKATLRAGGRRLVLKNPANGGRIKHLLALLPEAKFVYTVRNPYRLYPSTMWMYRTVLPIAQVQRIDPAQVEAHVLRSGARLMKKYLDDRALIPAGNLVQVPFEALERSPVAELRRVYDALDLPGVAEAEPAVRAYLDSIQGYQKNRYEPDGDVIEKVNRWWGFVFEPWGYAQVSSAARVDE